MTHVADITAAILRQPDLLRLRMERLARDCADRFGVHVSTGRRAVRAAREVTNRADSDALRRQGGAA